VFPNPVRDMARVRVGDALQGQVSVQVLDGIGRVVQRAELNVATGQRVMEIDMNALPAGTYFVSVRNGDRVLHRKVSKVD
jgi:hypothetical protein